MFTTLSFWWTNSLPNSNPEWYEPLFRITRAGSRTILCDLADPGCAVEFARRGYRILLLSRDQELFATVRQAFRERGLSSQLMGGQLYCAGELSLAKDFYELALFCTTPQIEAAQLEPSLKTGALAFWCQGSYQAVRRSQWLDGLPGSMKGIRYI